MVPLFAALNAAAGSLIGTHTTRHRSGGSIRPLWSFDRKDPRVFGFHISVADCATHRCFGVSARLASLSVTARPATAGARATHALVAHSVKSGIPYKQDDHGRSVMLFGSDRMPTNCNSRWPIAALSSFATERALSGTVLVTALIHWLVIAVMYAHEGLPYMSRTDENQTVDNALRMLKTGDPNPYFHQYPPLLTHVSLLADVVNYWRLSGRHPDAGESIERMADIGYYMDLKEDTRHGFVVQNPSFFLANRLLVVLLGLAVILTTCVIGSQLAGMTGGVIASLLLIQVPLFTEQATAVLPNVPFTLAVALALVFSLRYLASQRLFDIGVAGACVGVAVAFKYNAAIAVLTPLAALASTACSSWVSSPPMLTNPEHRCSPLRRALFVLCVTAVTFVVADPYAVLDYSRFVEHVGREIRHYGVIGHPGYEREPGLPHLVYQARALAKGLGATWACISAVGFCAVLLTHRRRYQALVVLIFPVLYSAMMAMQRVSFHRNWLPVYVYLSVYCAYALVTSSEWIAKRMGWPAAVARGAVLGLVLLASCAGLAGSSVRAYAAYRVEDTRTTAVSILRKAVRPEGAVAVAEELRVHPVDLATLPCSVHVVPAASIPASLGAVDYALTASSWRGARAPAVLPSPSTSVWASVEVPGTDGSMEAMGNQRNPSVLILKGSPRASAGASIISNGGFEGETEEIRYGDGVRGSLPCEGFWNVPEHSDTAMQVGQEIGEDAYQGGACLRVTRLSSSAANAFLVTKTDVPLESNAWYELSFAMKVNRGAGPDSIGVFTDDMRVARYIYNRVADVADRAKQPHSEAWTVYRYRFRGLDDARVVRLGWAFYSQFDVLIDAVDLRILF